MRKGKCVAIVDCTKIFEDEKERFYLEFDFDNDIKPVKEQTTKTGVFYNGEKIWNSRKTI